MAMNFGPEWMRKKDGSSNHSTSPPSVSPSNSRITSPNQTTLHNAGSSSSASSHHTSAASPVLNSSSIPIADSSNTNRPSAPTGKYRPPVAGGGGSGIAFPRSNVTTHRPPNLAAGRIAPFHPPRNTTPSVQAPQFAGFGSSSSFSTHNPHSDVSYNGKRHDDGEVTAEMMAERMVYHPPKPSESIMIKHDPSNPFCYSIDYSLALYSPKLTANLLETWRKVEPESGSESDKNRDSIPYCVFDHSQPARYFTPAEPTEVVKALPHAFTLRGGGAMGRGGSNMVNRGGAKAGIGGGATWGLTSRSYAAHNITSEEEIDEDIWDMPTGDGGGFDSNGVFSLSVKKTPTESAASVSSSVSPAASPKIKGVEQRLSIAKGDEQKKVADAPPPAQNPWKVKRAVPVPLLDEDELEKESILSRASSYATPPVAFNVTAVLEADLGDMSLHARMTGRPNSLQMDASHYQQQQPHHQLHYDVLPQPHHAQVNHLQAPRPLPNPLWVYQDRSGKTHGPFTPSQMHEWFMGGYFYNTLLIKHVDDPQFSLMGELIKRFGSECPFLVELEMMQNAAVEFMQRGHAVTQVPHQTPMYPHPQHAEIRRVDMPSYPQHNPHRQMQEASVGMAQEGQGAWQRMGAQPQPIPMNAWQLPVRPAPQPSQMMPSEPEQPRQSPNSLTPSASPVQRGGPVPVGSPRDMFVDKGSPPSTSPVGKPSPVGSPIPGHTNPPENATKTAAPVTQNAPAPIAWGGFAQDTQNVSQLAQAKRSPSLSEIQQVELIAAQARQKQLAQQAHERLVAEEMKLVAAQQESNVRAIPTATVWASAQNVQSATGTLTEIMKQEEASLKAKESKEASGTGRSASNRRYAELAASASTASSLNNSTSTWSAKAAPSIPVATIRVADGPLLKPVASGAKVVAAATSMAPVPGRTTKPSARALPVPSAAVAYSADYTNSNVGSGDVSDVFLTWCRRALSGLEKGNASVKVNDFINILLSIPIAEPSTIMMICDDTLAGVAAINPRKFGEEFCRRRREDHFNRLQNPGNGGMKPSRPASSLTAAGLDAFAAPSNKFAPAASGGTGAAGGGGGKKKGSGRK